MANAGGDGRQRDANVAVGVQLRSAVVGTGHARPTRGAVDLGRVSGDRAAAGSGLQTERACQPAGVFARAPHGEQLDDVFIGALLGTAPAGAGDILGSRAAMHAENLANTLARYAVAPRVLVEPEALLAQRGHLAHALQGPRRDRGSEVGRWVDERAGCQQADARRELGHRGAHVLACVSHRARARPDDRTRRVTAVPAPVGQARHRGTRRRRHAFARGGSRSDT